MELHAIGIDGKTVFSPDRSEPDTGGRCGAWCPCVSSCLRFTAKPWQCSWIGSGSLWSELHFLGRALREQAA